MKNKIIISIVAAMLSVSIIGCASNNSISDGSGASSEASSSTEEEPPFDYLAMDIYEHKHSR